MTSPRPATGCPRIRFVHAPQRRAPALWLLCALTACSSSRESSGASLITVSAEPSGDACPAGGQRIDLGVDDGDPAGVALDGTLQPGEVDATTYVCNGAAGEGGAAVVTHVVDEPAGAGCPSGGQRVQVGLDDGADGATAGDGLLSSGEVDETFLLCDGAAGVAGTRTLVDIASEPAGTDCAAGGLRVSGGADDGDPGGVAGDGILQPEEVETAEVLCEPASGGAPTLVEVSPAGFLDCAAGGDRVSFGADDGEGDATAGNGTLEPEEVDQTIDICRAASVGRYYLLPFAFNPDLAEQACAGQGLELATWRDTDDLDDMIAACDLGVKHSQAFETWVCFTRYEWSGGAPVSVYDGSAMPTIPEEYIFRDGPSPDRYRVVIRQDMEQFAHFPRESGYPLCTVPGT